MDQRQTGLGDISHLRAGASEFRQDLGATRIGHGAKGWIVSPPASRIPPGEGLTRKGDNVEYAVTVITSHGLPLLLLRKPPPVIRPTIEDSMLFYLLKTLERGK